MKKHHKILAVVIIIAGIILVIAALTTPMPTTVDLNQPAALAITTPAGGNIEVGEVQRVTWRSSNYAPSTVVINIIRKVADNPARYELVRTVTTSTLNDGSAVWVPAKTDAGVDVFVEIACVPSDQACRASQSSRSLAIVDSGRFINTANAYQAIEAFNNN